MDNNKIFIYKSRKKAIIIVFIGLLLGLAGWLLLQHATNNTAGWSFTILAILCVIFGIGSRWDRKPYLILTPRGITEMSVTREEIEWDAIRQVDEFYYRGQFFIRLLTDRNYKPKLIQPTWFYRLDRFYKREGVKAIFMRIGFLEVNSQKLSQFIHRMIKASPAERPEILNKFRLSIKQLSSNKKQTFFSYFLFCFI